MRVAVIGAGGWGTALMIVASRAGREVRLWSRNVSVVEDINERRLNGAYLEGCAVPKSVTATAEPGSALQGAEVGASGPARSCARRRGASRSRGEEGCRR